MERKAGRQSGRNGSCCGEVDVTAVVLGDRKEAQLNGFLVDRQIEGERLQR